MRFIGLSPARRVVKRFLKGGSTVNMCAIDLSTAFDKFDKPCTRAVYTGVTGRFRCVIQWRLTVVHSCQRPACYRHVVIHQPINHRKNCGLCIALKVIFAASVGDLAVVGNFFVTANVWVLAIKRRF